MSSLPARDGYEPEWIQQFHKGNYYKALELAMMFPGASSDQIHGLSALVIAQAVGAIVPPLTFLGN